jgi:hypothetical protein
MQCRPVIVDDEKEDVESMRRICRDFRRRQRRGKNKEAGQA